MQGLSDISDEAAIFDTGNGFTGVWHLEETSDTIALEATANKFHGRKKAIKEPVPIDGMIGKAQRFDGEDDYIDLGFESGRDFLNSTKSTTLSAWVNIGHFTDHNQGLLQLSIWDGGEINAASRACLEISTENKLKRMKRTLTALVLMLTVFAGSFAQMEQHITWKFSTK